MNSVFDMSNDMSVQRSITVLGATGSIGASTLDLVRRNPGAFRVEALTAHAQVAELAALARELREEGNVELVDRPTLFGVYFNRRISRRDHVALYVVRSFRQDAPPQPNNEIIAHGFFAHIAVAVG